MTVFSMASLVLAAMAMIIWGALLPPSTMVRAVLKNVLVITGIAMILAFATIIIGP